MHRRARLLLFAPCLAAVASCQAVFGVDFDHVPTTSDEDADGVEDDVDGCPHIAGEDPLDRDEDGIPGACDVDDTAPGTQRQFYAFSGAETFGLAFDLGTVPTFADGALAFGAANNSYNTFVAEVTAQIALIDVRFEFLGNAIESAGDVPWVELGVFSVHRAFTPDSVMRGDGCFLGRDNDSNAPGYLDLVEEAMQYSGGRFPGPLQSRQGTLRHSRAKDPTSGVLTSACIVTFDDDPVPLADRLEVGPLQQTLSGRIAFSAERTRVRLTHLWITYQP